MRYSVVFLALLIGCGQSPSPPAQVATPALQADKSTAALPLSKGDAVALLKRWSITPDDSQPNVISGSNGVAHVNVWYVGDDVVSLQLIGSLRAGERGELMAFLVGDAASAIIPQWPAENRPEWFAKALVASSNDVNVYRRQNDVEIHLITADLGGDAVVHTVSFVPARPSIYKPTVSQAKQD